MAIALNSNHDHHELPFQNYRGIHSSVLGFRMLLVDLPVFQGAQCVCVCIKPNVSALSRLRNTQKTAVYEEALFLDGCLLKWDKQEAAIVPNRFGPVPKQSTFLCYCYF